MSDYPPQALTAATQALAAEPGIGDTTAARVYAEKALRAAAPHLEDRESQEKLAEKLRAAFAGYGLTARQVAGVESACARLIEETARPGKWPVPKPRVPRESAP